ncbi:MAG: hypothetical protein A2297_09320 [Elusimicrobia bacterium RIFOXYB2_FULL_48_7]|nr:MAG: hypothetical protein A2297_09320 [Elusimicrobia bacterium RIFOXYB2_FULL_48_7]
MEMKFEQLDFNNQKPLYLQVIDSIEKKITSREIKTGQQLPTVEALCKAFDVSHPTIREALSYLIKAGYLSSRPKHGTIVISSEKAKGAGLKIKNVVCFIPCTGSFRTTVKDPYFYRFLSGAEAKAKEKGLYLLSKTLDESDEELNFEEKEKDIAGLVLAGHITPQHVKTVKKTRMPFVLIGDIYQKTKINDRVDVITSNDFQSTYMATKHLIDLGHTRIVYFVHYLKGFSWDGEYFRGYCQALKDAHIPFNEGLVLETKSSDLSSSYLAMKKLLEQRPPEAPFTGVVCSIDIDLYFGALKAFKENNIRVPEDLSVIVPEKIPGMTSFGVDNEDLGKAAIERLYERLTNSAWKPERIFIENKLIIGDSTAPLKSLEKAAELSGGKKS